MREQSSLLGNVKCAGWVMLEILASMAIVALITLSLFPVFKIGSANIPLHILKKNSAELRVVLYDFDLPETAIQPEIELLPNGDTVAFFSYSPADMSNKDLKLPFLDEKREKQ